MLEVDTRTRHSESSTEPNAALSDAKQVLSNILSIFHDNLKTVNTMLWPRWLKSYIEDLVKHELKNPMFSILKWDENHLRRENGFWDLDWYEKLHLLRVLVDHQLSYSAKIKSIIDENFEKALVKPTKQTACSSSKVDAKPSQNPLSIKPLGLDRHLKTWWQIDDSPRIYCSGNPYKANCTWTVLSTSQSEFVELSTKLTSGPANILEQPSNPMASTSEPCRTKDPSTKKVTIPAMFTANRKKSSPGNTSGNQHEQLLKFERQLSKAIHDVARCNIEAGEQRIQGLLKERERLEEIEAKKQRKLALANAPKQEPSITRATPGYGVRSRLRSQVSKPDYVVDSDLVDRQFELALRDYEHSRSDKYESNRGCQLSKRKRKGRQRNSSDSEDSDYQTGQDASVTGTNEGDDTLTMEEDKSDLSRRSRKRTCGPQKASASQGERRGMRVRPKIETECEDEPKPPVTEEEPRPSASTWSRSKASTSPLNSEADEKHSAHPTEPTENVSVWSRGKLVYVTGNNKYASKTVALSQKRKSICKQGFGIVTKTRQAQDALLTGVQPTSNTAQSLSALQARLAAMAGDDEDEEGVNGLETDEKGNPSSPQHESSSQEIRKESELQQGLLNLIEENRENPVGQSVSQRIQSPDENVDCQKTALVSPPSSLKDLFSDQPAGSQTNPNSIDDNLNPGSTQHLKTQYLSSLV